MTAMPRWLMQKLIKGDLPLGSAGTAQRPFLPWRFCFVEFDKNTFEYSV